MSQRSVSRSLVGTIYLWLLVGVLLIGAILGQAGLADASAAGAGARSSARAASASTGMNGVPALVTPYAPANDPPTISDLPDQQVPVNGSALGVIDLWAFADDAEDADDALIFTISNVPAPGAGVTIDANRYVDVNPVVDWTGEAEVEIQVEDTGGLTDSDRFRVRVGVYDVYLPLVMVRWPPIPDVPVLNPISNPDGDGSYVVSWSTSYLADAYVLQEDDDAAFTSPTQRYSGSGTSWNATGKSPGTYYYRVKATNAWGDSGWSDVEPVTVSPPSAEVYVKNDTGGKLCYEVRDTGIGEKCFSSGTHFYGTFPSGTYTWHASARCGSASGSRYYGAGEFIHRFWCG